MAKVKETPFVCHIFVCTHDRGEGEKSCGGNDSKLVRELLKEEAAVRDWKKQVRVSQSGCLGPCDEGPNVMIYPQKIWFSGVSANDVKQIISAVEEIIKKQ